MLLKIELYNYLISINIIDVIKFVSQKGSQSITIMLRCINVSSRRVVI